MKLLHVDASILGDNSVSRTLSAAAVDRLKSESPGLEIIRRVFRNLIMSFDKMGEHAKAEEVKELLLLIADGADLGV